MADAAAKTIFSRAIHWLRFLKRLRLPSVEPPVYQPLKDDFADYLRVQKGLSAETLRAQALGSGGLSAVVLSQPQSLRQLTIADLDEAIARKGRDDGYARLSIQVMLPACAPLFGMPRAEVGVPEGLAAGIVIATGLSGRKSTPRSVLE